MNATQQFDAFARRLTSKLKYKTFLSAIDELEEAEAEQIYLCIDAIRDAIQRFAPRDQLIATTVITLEIDMNYDDPPDPLPLKQEQNDSAPPEPFPAAAFMDPEHPDYPQQS